MRNDPLARNIIPAAPGFTLLTGGFGTTGGGPDADGEFWAESQFCADFIRETLIVGWRVGGDGVTPITIEPLPEGRLQDIEISAIRYPDGRIEDLHHDLGVYSNRDEWEEAVRRRGDRWAELDALEKTMPPPKDEFGGGLNHQNKDDEPHRG